MFEKAGQLTASNAGYISMKKLYSTIGLNGINEAIEFLGYDILFLENENEDEFGSENISQNLSSNTKTENSFDLIKKTQISQIFTFSNLNRIIFNEIKTEISLSCDGTTSIFSTDASST